MWYGQTVALGARLAATQPLNIIIGCAIANIRHITAVSKSTGVRGTSSTERERR